MAISEVVPEAQVQGHTSKAATWDWKAQLQKSFDPGRALAPNLTFPGPCLPAKTGRRAREMALRSASQARWVASNCRA